MTTLALNGFTSAFSKGGARANQFEVFLATPGGTAAPGETSDSFFIKAASLPGHTMKSTVNYRGRICIWMVIEHSIHGQLLSLMILILL